MSEIVKVENVTKYFKQEKVLDDVNMSLETGHIYGIVGKNGSRKDGAFQNNCRIYQAVFGKSDCCRENNRS